MKIELKTIFGELIIEGDFSSIADAVQAAAGKKSLSYANLSSADLSSADLSSANLSSANLRYAKNSELSFAQTRILPAGTLIVWKSLRGGIVAKLRIPDAAKRSHAFGRKCRAEYAEVIEMFQADGTPFTGEGTSAHDIDFKYRVGETVKPEKPFSDDWQNECESGIHFFITREEAADYAQ